MPNEPHPRSAWVEIGKQVISFVIGIVIAAFVLGRNSQRINDVVTWKAQIAPIIERMDSKGTLSFEHWRVGHDKESDTWKAHHDKEFGEWRDRVKELEREMKELNRKIDP